jgi:hypothetical protein
MDIRYATVRAGGRDDPGGEGCAPGTGLTISIAVGADGSSPRCVAVSAEQQLRVVNQSGGSAITVSCAGYPTRSVAAGKAIVYDRPFGRVTNTRVGALPGPGDVLAQVAQAQQKANCWS